MTTLAPLAVSATVNVYRLKLIGVVTDAILVADVPVVILSVNAEKKVSET